ncbi:MAG: hypothetical protein A3D92_12560 [Bacteroidetes bacterium RIFCSPHIGHO2_02_FULL_44_7]|nr:MAG: hypothetical protein A3D92_12560 [Bacteroidetes bacterium RIFCSPHIGHO2_02_FULL_44_7]
MAKKAVVVGSGVAGIAAAIRMARRGLETHVFEANDFPGGKINSRLIEGYRFDQGPSLLTCPEYLEELYELCDEDFSTFEMAELPSSFKYFYKDGTTLELSDDQNQVVKELADKLQEDPVKITRYLRKAEQNYALIAPLFIERSLHRWRHLLGKKLIKALSKLPQYKLFSTMNSENERYFKNPRTRQIFNRFAQYNGSHPFKAPAMMNMISHLEINTTPYLPKRGMIQITEELVRLAENSGVRFHMSERVEEILTDGKRVLGVRSANGIFNSDYVLSNMDVAFTYERLLPKAKRPKKILAQEKSSSVLAFYLGVRASFEQLHVHNMFFSDTDREEFDAVFEAKTIHEAPSFYLYISSKAIPEDAPPGCENWFVLINAPTNNGQDWNAYIDRMRTFVLEQIQNILGVDIAPLIEVEEVLEPRSVEQRYSGKDGSIYGNSSNNRFAAFYRHPNYSKQYKGLYFAGVSVHPGGGIPLALSSAAIACQCLFEDEGL